MERARTAVALRPTTTRPIFWVFLVLSILLKTSISNAATIPAGDASHLGTHRAQTFAE